MSLNLTREQAISEHRKMWRWIAEETVKRQYKIHKDDYLIENDKEIITAECFCCEYSAGHCSRCPIDWGSKVRAFMCMDMDNLNDSKGLYEKWNFTYDWQEAAELARQIAELPERPERKE